MPQRTLAAIKWAFVLLLLLMSGAGSTPTQAQSGSVIRVPQDVSNLQDAIGQVADGGVIELAAGTYPSPSANGFYIVDLGKDFTIRAVAGARATIDGGGSKSLLSFINSDRSRGGQVTFERLTFANGYTTQDGLVGGVTMQRAEAVFRDCRFENNVGAQSTTSGGATLVALGSTATFERCTWQNNSARNAGGALAISEAATAIVTGSAFTANRTNLPGHRNTAAGGAIFVGNSSAAAAPASLSVSKSTFSGNQAGYVGGAIFAIGEWSGPIATPRTAITITDSLFENNAAIRDPSVAFSLPTEGGAVHGEDQTTLTIATSRFVENRADTGGAANVYRALVTIDSSLFQGNRAVATGPGTGFGGAISVLSNDANDITTAGGTINRRSAQLTLTNSIIQGRFGSTDTVAQVGGGLTVNGDENRVYGLNGVAKDGTLAANRAQATLRNVVFYDTDIKASGGGDLIAGAALFSVADAQFDNVFVLGADAQGAGFGGGVAVLNQSDVRLNGLTMTRNTVGAGGFGAALFVQGSAIELRDCTLTENQYSPGVAEPINQSYGAAIFAGPDDVRNLQVSGTVSDCVLSRNEGLPIYDDDRAGGPINAVRYEGNTIYGTSFGDDIYWNSLNGAANVAELNALVVAHTDGSNTDKSARPNTAPGAAPAVGAIVALPTQVVSEGGATVVPFGGGKAYLAYAWSGAPATLNGASVTGNIGLQVLSEPVAGQYTLKVGDNQYSTTIAVIQRDRHIYLPAVRR